MAPDGEELLQEFVGSKDILAIRVASTDLAGLFVKRLTVPYNAAGLVFQSNGETTLLTAGQEITGRFDVVLAKTGEFHVTLGFLGLKSRDGLPVDARISFSILIDTRGITSFKAFARFSGGEYSMKDLERYLVDRTRTGLAQLAATHPVADLHRKDVLHEIEQSVAERLQSHFMGTGLVFDRVISGGFVSTEFERRAEEAQAADKQVRDREKRLKDVAEFLQKEESIQKLLSEIDDDRLKLVVYRELIEGKPRDGTTDWIQLEEGALRKVHGVMQKLLGGSQIPLDEVLVENAEKAYVAIGSIVVELDIEPPYAFREHEVREGIRSVRPARVSDRDLLLVGGKRTCILFDPSTGERFPFPLPAVAPPRGGINAVDAYGNNLYATHSEFGLCAWDINQPGKRGELIHPSLTEGQRTTRAVRIIKDKLLFATGPSVHYLDLAAPNAEPTRYKTSHGAITSTALAGRTLFAATEEGIIVSWELDKPDYPEVIVRRKSPVTGLRITKGVRGLAHLFYAFNDTSVHARVIGQALETEYEALGNTFTVFDAVSDLVVAPAHRARRVFIWTPANPRRPAHVANLSKVSAHEIMDVSLRKRLVLK